MGYTVTIKPVKVELIEKMISFLDTIAEKSKFKDFPILRYSKDLGYCNKKGHVGFDYGGMVRREYCYILIHWLSHKIGDGKHYYYDGTKEKLSDSRNKFGVREFDPIEIECKFFENIDFQAEIEEIDAAWEALDKQ